MWLPIRQLVLSSTPIFRTLTARVSNCPSTNISRLFHAVNGLNKISLVKNPTISAIDHQSQNLNILQTTSPLLQLSCGFKVKGVLKRRCKDCFHVIRQNRGYIICKTHPRHKQMAMVKRPENKWILTHAMQSKVRPY